MTEAIKIIDDDVKTVLAEAIADYEKRTGKTLQPAHIERSIIQTYAYREQLLRKGINHAFLQTFPQFATGIALDLCGEPMGCYRLSNQPAEVTLRFSVEGQHQAIVIPEGTLVAASDTRSVSQYITDVDISTPQGGTVEVTILTKQGLPSDILKNKVKNYISGEKRRPLCDTVIISSPIRVPYQIIAQLDLLETFAENEVKAKAETALRAYISSRSQKLGADIVPLEIQTALKVTGVYNVTIVSPQLTKLTTQQWAECESIQININAERQNG